MMERSTVCMSCGGLADPAHSCSMCGRIVCAKCYDSSRGMCMQCARKVRG